MSKARTRFLGVFLALFALCALFTVQALAAEPRATVSVSTGAELKAELEKDTTSTISVDDPTGYRVSLASATLRGNHTIILNDNDLYLSAALTIPNGATLRIEQGYLFSSNSLYSSPVIVNDGGSLMLGRAADTEYVDAHVSELVQFSDVTKAHWAYYQIVEATNAHDFTKADGAEDWTGLKK